MPVTENNYSENLENYTVVKVIGTGSFGICYKVKQNSSNKHYVWKAVDYRSMTTHEKQLLVTEVNLMGTLKNPYIVRYFGRIIHKPSGTLYIIMEWCENGDLNSLIKKYKLKNQIVNEVFIWKVLYQTARALEACHSLLKRYTVLHRDIKPANIFLDKDYNVKLGDFGLAKILENNKNFSSTVVGTPYYMSPEQMQGSKYNKKSDVWSLGCLIYELCCLRQPFCGNDLIELRTNITKNKFSRIPFLYTEYLDKMVKFLLNSNYEYRPSVEVIVHHPTVICNYDVTATPFFQEKLHDGCGDSFSQTRTIFPSVYKFKYDDGVNIENIIKKIQTAKIKRPSELEPSKITENVYNEKLLSGLKILQKREIILKAKEDSLKAKECILKNRESTLDKKQKQIEQREREVSTLQKKKLKSKMIEPDKESRKSKINVQLDRTTYSADPGDSSVLPTAVKLDPSKIIRPSCFAREAKKFSVSQHLALKECKNVTEHDCNRQPLSVLHNSHSRSKIRSSFSVKKYQNFIYKR